MKLIKTMNPLQKYREMFEKCYKLWYNNSFTRSQVWISLFAHFAEKGLNEEDFFIYDCQFTVCELRTCSHCQKKELENKIAAEKTKTRWVLSLNQLFLRQNIS